MLGAIFERFVAESPISVMVRGLMEGVFAPEKINSYFETNAQVQYTRELLFSSLVALMSLVVYGHAQERSLFNQVLETVKAGELWIGDRCMRTLGFLFGISKKGSHFVIREHKSLPIEPISGLRACGATETGELFEQRVRLKSFLKQPRAPKKKKDPPQCDPRHRHVSTARLLALVNKSP